MRSLDGERNWARSILTTSDESEVPHILQHLADGPICQPWSIYCPAGKISLAEAKAREAAQILDRSEDS